MPRASYFVILAGMRTGSNLLEEHLAAFPDLTLQGELFNPHFFGKPKQDTRFGLTMGDRATDPMRVIEAMKAAGAGLPGFRLFHDHDPRVVAHVLSDPACAKIVLTRRAIDSFVSLQIARRTGQWWLGDATSARSARVTFDPQAFADFVEARTDFQTRITRALHTTGQTAFHLTYDDLSDPDVIAGLARYLGSTASPDANAIRARVQNPTPVEDRLTNPQDARAALSAQAADIGAPLVHEPDRGPGTRFFRAPADAPLLYMPIRGAGADPVPEWLAALQGGDVLGGLTQKDLRQWKRRHPGHRSFTVLRHPLMRVHDAFCRNILPVGQDNFADIRHALIARYTVPLPESGPPPDWSVDAHRAAFLGFLTFLKPNLGGQTSLRVDNSWATQSQLLGAIAGLVVPDRVLREDTLATDLAALTADIGWPTCPDVADFAPPGPYSLSDIVTPDIEKAAEAAYRKDYMMFGFTDWSPPAPQAA